MKRLSDNNYLRLLAVLCFAIVIGGNTIAWREKNKRDKEITMARQTVCDVCGSIMEGTTKMVDELVFDVAGNEEVILDLCVNSNTGHDDVCRPCLIGKLKEHVGAL